MRITALVAAVFIGTVAVSADAQRRGGGSVTFEREVTARAGPVTNVKVILTPNPKPVPPLLPVPSLPAAAIGDPVAIDIPTFIEKNFIGRAAGKTSPLGCSAGGS